MYRAQLVCFSVKQWPLKGRDPNKVYLILVHLLRTVQKPGALAPFSRSHNGIYLRNALFKQLKTFSGRSKLFPLTFDVSFALFYGPFLHREIIKKIQECNKSTRAHMEGGFNLQLNHAIYQTVFITAHNGISPDSRIFPPYFFPHCSVTGGRDKFP